MRIAIFAESYPPVVNGAATAISLLVGALRERHEVRVYAPRFPGFKDRDPDVRRFLSYRLPPEPEYPLAVPFSSSLFREFLRSRLRQSTASWKPNPPSSEGGYAPLLAKTRHR